MTTYNRLKRILGSSNIVFIVFGLDRYGDIQYDSEECESLKEARKLFEYYETSDADVWEGVERLQLVKYDNDKEKVIKVIDETIKDNTI